MNTVQFTTTPQKGAIIIPEQYRDEFSGEVRVIVSKQESKKNGIELREELEKLFEQYKDVHPFEGVDPLTWQREVRNEWEDRITR